MNCTIKNIDISNKEIMFALNNIGVSTTYDFEITKEELIEILYQYIEDKLDICLVEENAFLENVSCYITLNMSEIDNEYSMDFIAKEISNHFGKSVLMGAEKETKIIKESVIIRKIFKNADVRYDDIDKCYNIYYDNLNDFQNTWIETYLIKKEKVNE